MSDHVCPPRGERDVQRLIDRADPAWPRVHAALATSGRRFEVLPPDRPCGERALLHFEASTHADFGAIAYETGGILLDSRWLRLHGSSAGPALDLLAWNGAGDGALGAPIEGLVIVAHDVTGGLFAINDGAFRGKKAPVGTVFHLDLGTLEWCDTGFDFRRWLEFLLKTDLDAWFEESRWPSWRDEVSRLPAAQAVAFDPPIWEGESQPRTRPRRVVPVADLHRGVLAALLARR